MPSRRTFRLPAWLSLMVGAPLLAAATLAAPALANGPAIVVDVESGRVIHADRATDPWFPASVTKLMTTYVALREIREGRRSMDTVLTMSPLASSMPPSKMGFRPGTEVTLENALKIIMVKSANDVSVAIAEGLGGSVEGFADMMNAAAQRLGMRESRFVNPHGLPDERQQTSARDMALLGRALILEFPQYRDLFAIDAIQFGKRVMRNHNGLMGRYPGADGMKTGFICASGFNVVASANRGGRRLITVVLGSLNATERTIRAASLFDQGFASGGFGFGGQRLEDLPPSAHVSPPNMRPVVCERRGPLPSEEDGTTSFVASAASGTADNPALGLMAAPAAASALAFAADPATGRPTLPPRGPVTPVPVWTGRRAPGSAVAVARPPAPASPAARAAIRPNGTPGPAAAQSPAGRSGPTARPGAIGATPAAPERPKPGAVTARRPAPPATAPEGTRRVTPPALPPARATAAPPARANRDAVRTSPAVAGTPGRPARPTAAAAPAQRPATAAPQKQRPAPPARTE